MKQRLEPLDAPVWPLSIKVYIDEGVVVFHDKVNAARLKYPEHVLRLRIKRHRLSSSSMMVNLSPCRWKNPDELWKEVNREY